MERIIRRTTREVKVGKTGIGGSNPIRVQSMTSTRTTDIEKTEQQIHELLDAGCELIRISIPDLKSLKAFRVIRRDFPDVPLIADIHFNPQLAISAIEEGADKIRINPGNINDPHKIKEIIQAARINKKAIRIGVNSGSLEKELIDKYGGVFPEALVDSALKWINFFTEQGFFDIVVSVKSSSVPHTIKAYTLLSQKTEFPLHLGVTEAGPFVPGTVKSSIALGYLLYNGIGDTIRVSLTDNPVREVEIAWEILKSLEIRFNGPLLISCPTCARTRVNLLKIVGDVEKMLKKYKTPLKVAVMGCEVNGPGEAKDADIGVAAEPGYGVIFKKGKILRKVKEDEIVKAIEEEIKRMEDKCNGDS